MGEVYRFHCGKCGYDKELFLGSGMLSIWEQSVRKMFAPQALQAFDRAKARGALEGFYWESERMVCPVCTELTDGRVLHYIVGGEERTISRPCPVCGGPLHAHADMHCPKCGGELAAEQEGFWD